MYKDVNDKKFKWDNWFNERGLISKFQNELERN